jgi:hypothetical protein
VDKLAANIKAASEPLPKALWEELNRVTDPLKEKLGPSFDYWQDSANDRTR